MSYLSDIWEWLEADGHRVVGPTATPTAFPFCVLMTGPMALDLEHPLGTEQLNIVVCTDFAGKKSKADQNDLIEYRRRVYWRLWEHSTGTVDAATGAFAWVPFGYTPAELAYNASTITFTEAVT